MKKQKLIVSCVFGICAVLLYLGTLFTEKTVSVMTINETVPLKIVLKDDHQQLIPLTVYRQCQDVIGCLNESLNVMSHSYGDLHAVLPLYAQVLSLECSDHCVVNFSKEILEFAPPKKMQVEQALSVLLSEYEDVEIRVENEKTDALQLHVDYLNPVHFVQHDYTQGRFYQMYQMKEINDVDLLVPVLIFAKSDDAISVIENYYSMIVSVQFDNVNLRTVQIEEGSPYRLTLSDECIENQGLVMSEVLPILHSIKRHTEAEEVEIVVSGITVDQINLEELILNEIHLSE